MYSSLNIHDVNCMHKGVLPVQFGQRYVEEQDDKTVTEWMDKQVIVHSSLPSVLYNVHVMLVLADLLRTTLSKGHVRCRVCQDGSMMRSSLPWQRRSISSTLMSSP